ncbi:MAG: succinylglutamate desuccinylase/aspartoacylase family protein [Candidatus Glassbacteria bacterium]|nr:succinylglutamate desuccinylase/aspartoacylase family protein [Candidatus Glassbacteria bacterium]
MRRIFSLRSCIPSLALLLVCQVAPGFSAETVHKTYFENTDYELHVYDIRGYEPGLTMMIIGGIQGNEPGGYLAADLYADISLRKGNLIVVPRANFHAILLNQRGPNGDMNRKFALRRDTDTETRIVEILKELISRSDVLLNLHDGSGFYREEYLDELHNPMRFGQSIIADADVYTIPDSGRVLRLGDIARKVCSVVNAMIPEENYRFKFNNHNTVSQGTMHPEQRLSATYYSLIHHRIPSFGIESSKEIPSDEIKVRHKRMVINAFMNEFDIVPENPKILVEKPVLNHLIVVINGTERVALKDGETLLLNPGDQVTLEHIDMNYSRGLAADIIGLGGINDLGKPFTIEYPTRVVIRKDSFKCASVKLAFTKDRVVTGVPRVAELASQLPRLELLAILVDGRRVEVADGATLEVPLGSVLEITDAVLDKPSYGKELQVNFKGFVGDLNYNTGEDRGYKIPTDQGLLRRHSIDGRGTDYPIVVSCQGREIGRVVVHLAGQRTPAGS